MDKSLAATKTAAANLPAGSVKDGIVNNVALSTRINRSRIDSELVPHCLSDTLKLKQRVAALRTFRLYNYQKVIPVIITVAKDQKAPVAVRAAAIEAMGWYVFSTRRGEFLSACEEIISSGNAPKPVINEALKTKNRLIAGANDPVTP
jgi:hypothetical protein